MTEERTIKIDGVRVVRDAEAVLWCEIAGAPVPIPKLMLRGAPPLVGQIGTIEVPDWFARENDLIPQ